MQKWLKIILMSVSVVLLASGCGGDAGGDGGADTTKPLFTSPATATVPENQTAATTLVATDANTVTYSISGTDAASFDVNSTSGVVTFKTAPDYESGKTSYTFTAKATDEAGNEATQDVTITVTDVDDTTPVFTSSATSSVAENQTEAITLAAADASTVTYAISGTDAASFDLNSTSGVVTFKTAPDFESGKTSYTFTAKATDVAGNEATQNVTITITDVDDTAPVFTSSATASVPENQTSAITLAATDETSTVTYAISGTDAASFDLNSTSGVVTFKSAPDYETKNTYTFTAKATDAAGNEATQDVTITVTDVDESQPLKKTGQTKSYDEDGNEIDTSLARDDGHYQTGVDFNYTRDDTKQIVTDHVTGLMWQDDANASSVTKRWLTEDNYDKCTDDHNDTACYDTSGNTAVTYCENLTLGGYTDWRLPTRKELVGLSDYGRYNPAISPVFSYTASHSYWSSTTCALYHRYAWYVYFYSASQGYDTGNGKGNSLYVRCVRAGE